LSQASITQERYWKTMTTARFQIFFIDEHQIKSTKLSTMMNIYAALTASGSVAAWAFWGTLPLKWIWPVLIALAELMHILRPYLRYDQRSSRLPKLINSLFELYFPFENQWLAVSKGEISDKKMNNMISAFNEKWTTTCNTILNEDHLPEIDSIMKKSDEDNTKYFESNFLRGM